VSITNTTTANDHNSIDLNNCDREPIHQLGTIQSFGFLLAVSSEWVVQHASENVAKWLHRESFDLIGQPVGSVLSVEAIHILRNKLQGLRSAGDVEHVFNLILQNDGVAFDVALHLSGDIIVIEGEPTVSEPDLSSGALVRSMVSRLQQSDSFGGFFREGTRQVRLLSGFDRVMIYRFNRDGSGEVISESLQGGLESFLGLRYPASDIPKQARALYERTWLRIISDVNAEASPIIPQTNLVGKPLDLSLSMLRNVSPIHIEYLRNMGVTASMSVSILRGGKLWGLFACHNMSPRHLSFERRTSLELFGQMFSLLLESRERERDAQKEAEGRALQNTLFSSIAAHGSSIESLSEFLGDFRSLLASDGVAVWLNGKWLLVGTTPTYEEFSGIVRFLSENGHGQVYATNRLGDVLPAARDYTERGAGMLAIPVSRVPRDYIVFFRRESTRSVTWAGNPSKPATMGPNGVRLTPRKSFEAWKEVVHGESDPWSDVDIQIADSLRITLLEIVLRLTDQADLERRTSQQKQELLIAELNHRVRNILSLVKGLLAQTSASGGSVQDFVTVVGGRIQALARAHDQITTDDWQPASLKKLIYAEGEAYLAGKLDRIRIQGQDVLIAPQAFTTMALVIHEMMTNSAKYGALCDRSGWVTISWSRDQVGRLIIDWRDQGGPPVQPPSRRGFGSTIIERSIPFDLQGEASVDYKLEGVHARFVLPAHLVTDAPDSQAAANSDLHAESAIPRFAGTMLLVEDNIIIAMDAEDSLHDLGIAQVDIVGSVSNALHYLADNHPAAALIDFNLGDENSIPVARRLTELGIPFFFATGYGDMLNLPEEFKSTMVIKKPYTAKGLAAALKAIMPGTNADGDER
jgi:light-regulated signal transduction histidine kinase (bacteriophytochrome)/CheY-like chemotaxis protein